MEPRTLAQAKAEKVQELRGIAETEYWSKFPTVSGDLPMMAKDKILIRGIIGGSGSLTQSNRDTLLTAEAVTDKLRTKLAAVSSQTTIAAVDAITWTSTP